jgi:hypothetical protein
VKILVRPGPMPRQDCSLESLECKDYFFKAADVTMSEPASNVEERRRNDVYRALSCFS